MSLRAEPGRGLYAGGYLTLYLALTLAVMLSFLLAVINGARVSSSRLKAEITVDTALNSVLGEFSRALLEQYDLFFADASYGSGNASVQRVSDRLRMYAEKNLEPAGMLHPGLRDFRGLHLEECEVTSARFAADEDGRALKEQIYAYMTADPAGALFGELLTMVEGYDASAAEEDTWSSQWEENWSAFTGSEISEENEDSLYAEQGETIASFSALNEFRLLPVLWQVLGSGAEVSEADIKGAGDPLSRRRVHYGQATVMESSHGYPPADAFLMDMYICEKCGSYREPLEKGLLKYQQEYIVFGKDTDRANLESMARRLLIIRTAANLAYIYTDAEKTGIADAIGAVFAFLTALPELQPVVKNLVLLGWSYMESIQDVRTLFDGGKVPPLKTKAAWKTSLMSLLFPEARDTAGSESGLTYENYLQIFLFIMDGHSRTFRLMDIMESDIRTGTGCSGFCMDWCLDTLTAEFDFGSGFGKGVRISRTAGYN
ncbi:MAG: hypothetical protein IJ930_03650 [Lachnospiraceae bacterium]|nr:hypothetical protein [Lachnospiraceae bacterium]